MDLWKIILIIILIIVIIIGIVNIYFKTDILYDSILDCNTDFKAINDLKKESSANMTFSMWYFINDFTTSQTSQTDLPFLTFYNGNSNTGYDSTVLNQLKSTFNDNFSTTSVTKKVNVDGNSFDSTSSPTGSLPTIHICLNDYRNDIHIYVRTSTDSTGGEIISRFVLKNIPLQKWVNLTISVDNNVFDVYLDGKLHNSFILPDALYTQAYNIDDNKLYLNGDGSTDNHNTFLTRIRYINSAVTTTDAYDIYKDGISSKHSTSLFNKYNLKVSFLEYNQEKSSFLI